jgi:hypothetical protein
MKLLLCRECQDIIRLVMEERKCSCGKVSGKYTNNLLAEYKGETAVPIGISNSTLVKAVNNQPKEGLGTTFEAFVIPKNCETFTNLTKSENKYEFI